MSEEYRAKLYIKYPYLYKDKNASIRSSAMGFGFCVGDGWLPLIDELSSKLEPLIRDMVKNSPDAECRFCGCKKAKHYASATSYPKRCLAIKKEPFSKEKPPENYYACPCEQYDHPHPRAVQVKEKFGQLRFYLSTTTEEMGNLIREAETKSGTICEECGQPGKLINDGGWLKTTCDSCLNK
jgi:hypothetical protein